MNSPALQHKCVTAIAFLSFLLSMFIIMSCEVKKPVKIGYVGGLTGRVAGLGIAGRDGVILAVEEVNRSGGVNKMPVELIVKDDRQDKETALKVNHELVAEGVSAIIGHMTSSMSKVGYKIANENRVLMISPTTSTNELSGKDDYFFRLYPASDQAAEKLAGHAFNDMGLRRINVVYDIGNRAHTESWYLSFKYYFEENGGSIVAAHTYKSEPGISFLDLASDITAQSADGLFILANALDTAMICQQLVKLDRKVPVITSEWSATEDVLQFGGKAVEGIHFFHTFDKNNSSKDFLKFKNNFSKRFGYEAGFASAHSYDSARLVIKAIKINPDPSILKETIKSMGPFQGLQGEITFDDYGDVKRNHVLMTIQEGRFKTIQQ